MQNLFTIHYLNIFSGGEIFSLSLPGRGVYGVQEGTLEVVEFAYALETVPGTTNAEVEQIIDDLEAEIAASVVQRLVPECQEDTTARRRLLQQNPHGTQRRLAQVLMGLSPKPDDRRITDRECDKEVGDNRCDLVLAFLTIWGTKNRFVTKMNHP